MAWFPCSPIAFVIICVHFGTSVQDEISDAEAVEAIRRRFDELQSAFEKHFEKSATKREVATQDSGEGDGTPSRERRFDFVSWSFQLTLTLFDEVVGSLVLMNSTLFVAIILVLQWHVRFHFPKAPFLRCLPEAFQENSMLWRTLGIDICIASIYYDDDMPFRFLVKRRTFCTSCMVVLFDRIGIYYLFRYVAGLSEWSRHDERSALSDALLPFASSNEPPEARTVDHSDEPPEARNKYRNLAHDGVTAIPTCLIQLGLFWLYIENLNDDRDTRNVENVHWAYWTLGVVIQLFVSDRLMGEDFDNEFWNMFLKTSRTKDVDWLARRTSNICFLLTNEQEWWLRCFLDYLVNNIARLVILFTFPIIICVEEPLDFVKDCTAIFFITTMDNMGGDDDSKSYFRIMAELKEREFWAINKEEREKFLELELEDEEYKFVKDKKGELPRRRKEDPVEQSESCEA